MPDDARDQDIINRWITVDHRHPGIDGVRLGYRTHVWAIIGQIDPDQDDPIEAMAQAHDLPREAVFAALAWYQRHPDILASRAATYDANSLLQLEANLLRVKRRVQTVIDKSSEEAPPS